MLLRRARRPRTGSCILRPEDAGEYSGYSVFRREIPAPSGAFIRGDSSSACRNPLPEVVRFFERRHHGHFRLYDLRGEKGAQYDPEKFGGPSRVAKFGFFDHNPASLKLIRECIDDMHAFLLADPENVVAVHWCVGALEGL